MKSRLQVVGTAALFSTGGAAIKATSLDAWQVAGLRSGIAALVLLILLPETRRRWSPRMLLVGSVYAGALISFVLANKLTTAASTVFLQTTSPLYVLALAPWLLAERLTRRDLSFMLALSVGLVLLLGASGPVTVSAPEPLVGNVFAALSALCFALMLLGLRWLAKSGPGHGSPAAAVTAGNVIAFLACAPVALPVAAARGIDWAVVGYLGVFQVGLAYVLLASAVRHVPALEISLLLLIEPVLSPLWAWWLHGEVPGARTLAGGGVILMATLIKTLFELRRSPVRTNAPSGGPPDRL